MSATGASRSWDGAHQEEPSVAVLVPIKSLERAKGRLADRLDHAARRELAQIMARGVIAAASPTPCYVACDDIDVARQAESWGAEVLWCPVSGLNESVTYATTSLRARGVDHVVIAHGDLPLAPATAPGGFDPLVATGRVRLVTDTAGDGTNVLSLPLAHPWTFFYGPGSRARHVEEAARRDLPIEVITHDLLSQDLDTYADLDMVTTTLLTDEDLARRCDDLTRLLRAQSPSRHHP